MKTLAQPENYQEEIKKSRFIVYATRCDDGDTALEFIAANSHSDANHNCWAYKTGSSYRFTDDGEPTSTAGRPILAAIEGQGFDHVAVLVVRYFGGIKLGAGGLIRAYGGSAARCLQQAVATVIQPKSTLQILTPFTAISQVHHLNQRFSATTLEETYLSEGVQLAISLNADSVEAYRTQLTETSRGQVQIKVIDTPGNDAA